MHCGESLLPPSVQPEPWRSWVFLMRAPGSQASMRAGKGGSDLRAGVGQEKERQEVNLLGWVIC